MAHYESLHFPVKWKVLSIVLLYSAEKKLGKQKADYASVMYSQEASPLC